MRLKSVHPSALTPSHCLIGYHDDQRVERIALVALELPSCWKGFPFFHQWSAIITSTQSICNLYGENIYSS